MKESDVSVFCSVPNNGHFTLVFTDEGMIVSANCRRKDVYEGLVRSVADLLVEFASEICPIPDKAERSLEVLLQSKKYTRALKIASAGFISDVADRAGAVSIEKHLEKIGMPSDVARRVASTMVSDILGKPDDENEDDDSETSV